MTLFLKQSVREQGLPFAITRATPNTETVAVLKEYEAMKKHPEKYTRYDSFADLMGEVLSDA